MTTERKGANRTAALRSVRVIQRLWFGLLLLVVAMGASSAAWSMDLWLGKGDCLRPRSSDARRLSPEDVSRLEAESLRLRNSGPETASLRKVLSSLEGHYECVHATSDLARVLRLEIALVQERAGKKSIDLVPLFEHLARIEAFELAHADEAYELVSRAVAIEEGLHGVGSPALARLIEQRAWIGARLERGFDRGLEAPLCLVWIPGAGGVAAM